MKTRILLIVALVLVIVLGVFVLFTPSSESVLPTESAQENTFARQPESALVPQTGVGTVTEIRELGQTLECTLSYRDGEDSDATEGTLFTRNGMFRADYVKEDATLGQVLTSVIAREGSLYVWSVIDGESYGVSGKDVPESKIALPVSFDESVRYSCSEWLRTDDSIFEVPSKVLFKDVADANIEYGTIYEEGEFPF